MTARPTPAKRRLNPRVCRGCGVIFQPKTALQRYGSERCKEHGPHYKSEARPGAKVYHR